MLQGQVPTQEQRHFAVIGGGKMGEAILSGWLASTQVPADELQSQMFTVVEPGEERRAFLTETYGVECVADASGVTAADVVVLSVKPQVMSDALAVVRENPCFGGGADGPLFVSIAAGLTCERLLAQLPAGARLVRVMPNMPLTIGAGASAVTGAPGADEADVRYVADLFGCLGVAVVVEESQMDAVCALSGSGPAYVAALVESLRDAAAAHGLDADLAEKLAIQTVYGTSRLMAQEDRDPAELRISVCSPGGTTLAALDAMQAEGFDAVFRAGIDAAVRRSQELAQC